MFVDVVLDQPIGQPLTYKATPESLPYLQPGSLVEVALGPKRHAAVITRLRRHAPTGIKTIRKIHRLLAASWASKQTLLLASHLATYTGEAPGICLFRLLPPSSKRPVSQNDTVRNSLAATTPNGKRFHLYAPRAQRFEKYLQMIQKAVNAGEQTLIVVPNVSIPILTSRLSKADIRYAVASGDRSAGKQRALAQAFSAGDIDVLVSTRHAIGWQAKHLRFLIVDDPTHPAHTDEQRPYADSATIAWLRHGTDGSHLIFGTSLPTLGMVLTEQRRDATRITVAQTVPIPTIANTPTKQLLLPDIEALIADKSQADLPIAIITPRAGIGGMLTCQQCQWSLHCANCNGQVDVRTANDSSCYDCNQLVTIPTSCPSCYAAALKLVGVGDQAVRVRLMQELGTLPSHLYIGTTSILETQQRFRAIVFVYADSPLLSPKLDRPLSFARSIWEACGLSDRVIVQTREPAHPFWLFLSNNPTIAFQRTLLRRKKAHLPPFSRHLHIDAPIQTLDPTSIPSTTLARRTSSNGRDSMDLLVPTANYQQTLSFIATRQPKARLRTDSILSYA